MSNWEIVKQHCDAHQAALVAVSKTRTIAEVMALYQKGQRIFGENRVQELLEKAPNLPDDIEWHLIGHLQTNKVKQILPKISCIHSLESIRLMEEIETQAAKLNKVISVLAQVHVAAEETKFGLSMLALTELLDRYTQGSFKHIKLIGIMGMASFTDNHDQIRAEFKSIQEIFQYVKNGYFIHQAFFKEISMGMSGDYLIALEEGSTMVRVGSLLFEK
ncbi:MAG: YggS family pyridoxal phosphate-dependent enzyme [Chitinophagaceae bacterium]|nr:YggS family pyridoxal phosphate-dependent enzyme [Chitinophagaceae bacterium]